MELLTAIFVVYCMHLLSKWLDKRATRKFVNKICGESNDF